VERASTIDRAVGARCASACGTILAVPGLCVVSDARNWSAPCVMAALARVVHDRERAASRQNKDGEDDQE